MVKWNKNHTMLALGILIISHFITVPRSINNVIFINKIIYKIILNIYLMTPFYLCGKKVLPIPTVGNSFRVNIALT